jgi:hypothetical protein
MNYWPLLNSSKNSKTSNKTLKSMKDRTSQLDNITLSFLSSFGSLALEQLNWKPNPETWSIAQNIEHLILVNETYYPVLASVKTGTYTTPFIARIGFVVSFMGRTILDAVKPDRKKKMKTFPIWEPTTSQVEGDILKRFEQHQTELKQQFDAAKEWVDKGTIISSPANRNIVYKLETAFDIIISHEQRHFEQAKEILQLLNENTSH